MRFGKSRSYAATAQAEYRDGPWTGSVGLRAVTFEAPSQRTAEQMARTHYMQEWHDDEENFDLKLVKLHLSVVEL